MRIFDIYLGKHKLYSTCDESRAYSLYRSISSPEKRIDIREYTNLKFREEITAPLQGILVISPPRRGNLSLEVPYTTPITKNFNS